MVCNGFLQGYDRSKWTDKNHALRLWLFPIEQDETWSKKWQTFTYKIIFRNLFHLGTPGLHPTHLRTIFPTFWRGSSDFCEAFAAWPFGRGTYGVARSGPGRVGRSFCELLVIFWAFGAFLFLGPFKGMIFCFFLGFWKANPRLLSAVLLVGYGLFLLVWPWDAVIVRCYKLVAMILPYQQHNTIICSFIVVRVQAVFVWPMYERIACLATWHLWVWKNDLNFWTWQAQPSHPYSQAPCLQAMEPWLSILPSPAGIADIKRPRNSNRARKRTVNAW